jgi:hypothetical protein
VYQITYFGHELGDMQQAHVAITFESAVADVLLRLSRSSDYHVTASALDGVFALEVSRHGVTIATIAACDVVCYTGGSNPVQDACAALRSGSDQLIVQLFSPL